MINDTEREREERDFEEWCRVSDTFTARCLANLRGWFILPRPMREVPVSEKYL